MTPGGLPFRLFTVNRWVTGEVWYRADDVIRMLDVFKIDHAQPSWPLNRWISAMIALFKPQIAELLRARDRKVADWREQNPEADVFEDRDLEVASFPDISVEHQVREGAAAGRESGAWGKSGAGRVDPGGRRIIKKKKR